MFSENIIQELKQVNISSDPEKTKQRTAGIWKSASKADQECILALAGIKRTTVQRAYKTGSISAKLVVPIAQTLDVDPYYLTGQSDERGSCSDEQLKDLLKNLQYDKLLAQQEKEEKKQLRNARKQAAAEEEARQPASAAAAESTENNPQNISDIMMPEAITPEQQACMDNLTEEKLIILLKSVLIRAEGGGKHAELANQIKLLLIS